MLCCVVQPLCTPLGDKVYDKFLQYKLGTTTEADNPTVHYLRHKDEKKDDD